MTFQDLPADWPTMPLTDPRITDDVLDLLVSARDRDLGAIHVLMCDPGDRLVQPCVVDDVNGPRAGLTQFEIIDPIAGALRHIEPDGSLLVAIARRRGLVITDDDRAWHQAAIDACRDSGVRLLGVHVVTHCGSARLPDYASTHHNS
jgi:hypothetical protein